LGGVREQAFGRS